MGCNNISSAVRCATQLANFAASAKQKLQAVAEGLKQHDGSRQPLWQTAKLLVNNLHHDHVKAHMDSAGRANTDQRVG